MTDLWGRQTKNGDRPKRVRDIRGTQTKESKRQKKSQTTKGDGQKRKMDERPDSQEVK